MRTHRRRLLLAVLFAALLVLAGIGALLSVGRRLGLATS